MSDLTRLLEGSPQPRARALLRAGLRDAPKPGSAQRVLVALGAAAAVSGGAVAAAKASALTAGGSASKGATLPSLALLGGKWLAVGAVSGGVLAAGSLAIQSGAMDSPTTHGVRVEAPAPGRPREAPRAISSPAPSAPALAVEPSPAEPKSMPSASTKGFAASEPRPAPALAAKADQGKLAREVQAIDAARRSLTAGDATRALTELSRYELLVETHVLDREATVLRIEALLQRGEKQRARELFENYVEKYPGDPHASRLRAHWGSIAE